MLNFRGVGVPRGGPRSNEKLRSLKRDQKDLALSNRKNGPKSLNDSRQNFERRIELLIRREAREAEANRAVRNFVIDLHRSQHRRGLEASATARGAGAGADSVFAEQKEDRFGLETRE